MIEKKENHPLFLVCADLAFARAVLEHLARLPLSLVTETNEVKV